MQRATILGSAGYAGQETLDRVLGHPGLELVALGSDSLAGQAAAAHLQRLTCRPNAVRATGEERGKIAVVAVLLIQKPSIPGTVP